MMNSNTRFLKKLSVAVKHNVSQEVMDAEIDFTASRISREIVLNLHAHIWSETLGKKEIKIPITWFQALKEEHFPTWFLKKWPVRYRVRVFDMKVIYPTFKAPSPDMTMRMRVVERDSYYVSDRKR